LAGGVFATGLLDHHEGHVASHRGSRYARGSSRCGDASGASAPLTLLGWRLTVLVALLLAVATGR
jgi:hypothetical protein